MTYSNKHEVRKCVWTCCHQVNRSTRHASFSRYQSVLWSQRWQLNCVVVLSCRFLVRSWKHFRPGPLLRAHAVSRHREVPQREWVQPIPERARWQFQRLHQRRAHQLLLWRVPWAPARGIGQVNNPKKAVCELLNTQLACLNWKERWDVLTYERVSRFGPSGVMSFGVGLRVREESGCFVLGYGRESYSSPQLLLRPRAPPAHWNILNDSWLISNNWVMTAF